MLRAVEGPLPQWAGRNRKSKGTGAGFAPLQAPDCDAALAVAVRLQVDFVVPRYRRVAVEDQQMRATFRLPDPYGAGLLIFGTSLALVGAASAAKMTVCRANYRGRGRSHRVRRMVLVPTLFQPDQEV